MSRISTNPKISIIVPVYKVEPFIHKCVESILEQSFTNFELILVDDGSPDKCGEICEQYASRDIRVKVIHKENGGLSSARNAGIDIAQGEFLAFIDSDDYIEKDMFEILYSLALQQDVDVVECSLNIVTGNNIKTMENDGLIESGNNIFALKQLLEKPYRNVAVNKLYKKELFHNLRYPNKLYEDGFLAYKIYFNLRKYAFVGLGLYNYVKREDSIMGKQTTYALRNLDGLEVQVERYEFLKNKTDEQLLIDMAELHLFNQIIFHYKKLQDNKELDPNLEYRNRIKNILLKNYSRISKNRMLSQYRLLMRYSNLNINIFDKVFSLYELYLSYFKFLSKVKYYSKRLGIMKVS